MIKIEEEYSFSSVDKKILESNLIIERNIERYSSDDRGFLSQNVLSQLRTFLEYIGLKIYLEYNYIGKEIIYDDKTVSSAMNFIKGKGNLKFIERFHYYLQITKSHYIENDDGAERLMLKYCKYLIYLKQLLHQKYNIEILSNINKFPVNLDKTFSDYYEKISKILNEIPINRDDKLDSNKYYIQKIKPFFINGKVYYEITLTVASDKSNKFDRMIAFTRINIMDNYSIKIAIKSEKINIFGQETEINIITNWNVAIRACEIRNFCKIIGIDKRKYNANDREYVKLMEIMTNEQFNLHDLVMLNDSSYLSIKSKVNKITSATTIFDMLDFCRNMFKSNLKGSIY